MNLDSDPIRCPLISLKYKISKHGPLSLSLAHILSGGDGALCKVDVMDHMTCLISDGIPFNGPDGYEIGRWGNRIDDIVSAETTSDDMYYAWVDLDLWDYDPHLVLYTKEEFMILFEDCCQNYVASHPERKEEFAAALAANGMSLNMNALAHE